MSLSCTVNEILALIYQNLNRSHDSEHKFEVVTVSTIWRVNLRHRAKFQAGHFRDGHLSIFQDGGRPPHSICYTPF